MRNVEGIVETMFPDSGVTEALVLSMATETIAAYMRALAKIARTKRSARR